MICERGERERVREHLAGALRMVGARDVSSLPAKVRRRRERLVSELVAYRERGRFPKNETFPHRRMPAFVDAHDTRCALAHLVEASGDRTLVADVARARNFAFVRELADDARLVEWLDAHGFTQAEAARIQPTYGGEVATQCVCPSIQADTVLEVEAGPEHSDAGTRAYTITAVYGSARGFQVGGTYEERPYELTKGLFALDGRGLLVGLTALRGNGERIRCADGYAYELSVTKSEAIALMLDKKDCYETLVKKDVHWSARRDQFNPAWHLPEKWELPEEPSFLSNRKNRLLTLGGTVVLSAAAVGTIIVRRRRKKDAS